VLGASADHAGGPSVHRENPKDRKADGTISIGPSGSAKSVTAKATGGTAGIPTIAFDLPAMESSLVGASAERLRSALQITDAVSHGRMLFIATCNSIASLPSELRRRCALGTFFFDLTTADERETIWRIYLKKDGVSGELPDNEGWTGAEIKERCRKAYRLGYSTTHRGTSCQFHVPQLRESRRYARLHRGSISAPLCREFTVMSPSKSEV